ncbi:arylsulfatase A-like enzyme [Larkinella arboricola]|uniref:Arylsulfatase A-like enzyme n=1 Tax=Larkinella arboricola TaxID=643671 RepID=A0A327X0Y4_LARAB|nr:arylsulfatase [Larkinella arboricola]RAJ97944.1 arylsulfatase A-like enzyme [Larkinella arboricola]
MNAFRLKKYVGAVFSLLTVLVAGWFLVGYTSKAPAVRPNIIYIYADDLGYAELGCYGQQKIRTPHLDQIAREGIRFTQHYTSMPVCAPARCMLLTGRHGGHSYIRGNYEMGGFADSLEGGQMPLYPGAFTIGRMLQQSGYRTACIGKWGLGMANTTGNPNEQGFDYFYGYLDQKQAHNFYPTHLWENGKPVPLNNPVMDVHRRLTPETATPEAFAYYRGKEYAIDNMAQKAQAFVRENKNRPFFLYLPFTVPHVSLQAPEAAVQEYVGKFDDQAYLGQRGYASTPYPRATYAAMITYMDKQIGALMQLLKELKLDDNTIVMFSSDNGTTFNGGVEAAYFKSVGNLRGLKMDVYEGGIREPMIARWPGKITAGKVTDHVSVQYDLLATLAELVGYQKPFVTDGISFLPTLLGQPAKQKKHAYIYWEYAEKGGQLAIRMGNWKAVKTDVRKNRNGPWELYDLSKDESETTNLAASHPGLLQQFDAIVAREHVPAHINDWEIINPKTTVLTKQ